MVVALTLTGCFGGPGPHEYELVDAAAKRLHIAQVGTVLYENHYGKLQRMDGPGPGVEFFVATDDASAGQAIVDAAVRNGWDGQGDFGASVTADGHFLQLGIRPWEAGVPAQMGDGKTHTWDRPGFLVGIDES